MPRKTVKSFFESLPEFKRSMGDDFSEFNNQTYLEKAQNYSLFNQITWVYLKKDDYFDFGKITTTIKRVGTVFIRKNVYTSIVHYSNKKIKLSKEYSQTDLEIFFKHSGIQWIKIDIINKYRLYIIKPRIFQQLITGRIYSEETLVKGIFRLIYGIKNINWRECATFIEKIAKSYVMWSILDLKYFTRDVNKSIIRLNSVSYTEEIALRDLLQSAIKLQEIVDFTWSKKRIHSEHQRQIEEINRTEIKSKDNNPIYDNIIYDPLIKQLNTELDVFNESSYMHNCIYSCYYHSIKKKEYIAFHLKGQDDCTFGICKVNGECKIEQIKTFCNGNPGSKDVVYIESFFEHNKAVFDKMLCN